jgi:hypothetical protein
MGKGYRRCGVSDGTEADKVVGKVLGHCREAQADTVFMFLTAAVMLVCALMVFLRMKKGY